MSGLNSARFAEELTYDTSGGTGAYQAFSDVLQENPAMILFDNQSDVAVIISDDGTTNGKTFVAGEAIVLDLRTNKELTADDMSWRKLTQFFANSAVGTGFFRISYVYSS